jgi:Family of unknown function (DUF6314)
MAGLLPSLSGNWLLARDIDDGSSMVGAATIRPRRDGGFGYCEQGRLTLPGGRVFDASRRYIFLEADGGFAVLFAETPPRLFHRIALCCDGPDLVGAATHFCDADRYDSRYEFRPGGGFVVEHRVSGPRKRYVILTRYSRPDAPTVTRPRTML